MINFKNTPIFLAPLAGLTDLPFRTIAKKCGCDVSVSEMISANALAFGSQKTIKMLSPASGEKPYIIQIESADEQNIKKAIEFINTIKDVDGIDLNCGCPVPKVFKQGAGSALLQNPTLLCKILESIKKTSNKRYTSVKLRLGIKNEILSEFARDIESAGADYIVIHARTRAGGFSAEPDFDAVARIKQMLKIPVIANGSIDENNFSSVMDKSGANGVMIGRAAIGKPWIFGVLKGQKEPSAEEKKQIILEHFDLAVEFYEKHAVAMMRKHLHEYSKGLDGAPVFRTQINALQDADEVRKLICEFFKNSRISKGKKCRAIF